MARHPSKPGAARAARNLIYAVLLALLLASAGIFFTHGPFSRDESKSTDIAPPPDANMNVEVAQVNETAVLPPLTRVEPEPNLPQDAPVAQPGPTVEPYPASAELITETIAETTTLVSEGAGGIIEARNRLNELLQTPMSPQQRALVKDRLSEFTDKWLFSRTVLPGDELCGSYRVKPGDALSIIGGRHKVPYEILMQINNISRPEALRAGETIKVINGPFRATVHRSTFTMDVYLQNTFVSSFPVGLGKPGMETPTGLWRDKHGGKLIKPNWTNPADGRTYYPDDPDYPLGSRWIGLEGLSGAAKDRTGFAIHGTSKPEQIGAAGSQGCIRTHDVDVVLLYNLLFPGSSLVEVVD
jgi:lipoprotein-anchoring transpeptidase ErfK/SrfK